MCGKNRIREVVPKNRIECDTEKDLGIYRTDSAIFKETAQLIVLHSLKGNM